MSSLFTASGRVQAPRPTAPRWRALALSVVLALIVGLIAVVDVSASSSTTAEQIGTFPASEGSGVVASRQYPGVYWAHRDSGGGERNVLYAFKVEDGKLVEIVPGTTFRAVALPDVANHDWEDIAVDDSGNIWVGDIGNNDYNRSNLAVHRIVEPDPYEATSADVAASYPFTWPDGACSSCSGRDAESLLVRDGNVYIVSKAKKPALYRFPTLTRDTPVELERLAELTPPSSGWADLSTGADLAWDGSRLAVTIAGHHAVVYETPNTHLSGDELLTDMVGREPAFAHPYRDSGSWEPVEGVAFTPGGQDLVMLSEDGPLLYAVGGQSSLVQEESTASSEESTASSEESATSSNDDDSMAVTGSGTESSGGWQPFTFDVAETSTISARLDWDDESADLNLWLKDPAGETVAYANGTDKPETLTHGTDMRGEWSIVVHVKSGSASFQLDLTTSPVTADTNEDDGTLDSQTATTDDQSSLAPGDGALLGLWSKPKDGDWTKASAIDRFEELEALAGRSMDIAHSYYSWDDAFPTWRESWAAEGGRTPLVSWDGTDTGEIAAGSHDDVIEARAADLKEFAEPVLLRWMWEMDIKGDRVANPEEFISAWRRIHDTFAARDVTNVEWVWCPTAWNFVSGDAQPYYPGDAYVDWTCADGYNWAPGRDGSTWRSLTDIFAEFYAWAEPIGKPIMIGETGVQERDEGEKAQWLRDVPEQLQSDMPAVAAMVYFDSDTIYPWWLDTSTSSTDAWGTLAQDPYLNTRSGDSTDDGDGEEIQDDTTSDGQEAGTDPDDECSGVILRVSGHGAGMHQFDLPRSGPVEAVLEHDRRAKYDVDVMAPNGASVLTLSTDSRATTFSWEADIAGTWTIDLDHRGPRRPYELTVRCPES